MDKRGFMRKGVIAAVVLVLFGVLLVAPWKGEVTTEPEPAPEGGTLTMVQPDAAPEPDLIIEPEPDTAAVDPQPETSAAVPTIPQSTPEAAEPALPGLPAPPAEATEESTEAERDPAEQIDVPAADAEPSETPSEDAASEEGEERMAALTSATDPTNDNPSHAAGEPANAEATDDQSEAEAIDLEAPIIDVARVSADGQVVIAGRSAPGAAVEVLIDGEVVGSAEADASGSFVAVLEAGTSAEARQMVLRVARKMDGSGGGEAGAQAASETETTAGSDVDVAALEEAEPERETGAAPASQGAATESETDSATTGTPERVAALDPASGSADPGYAFSAPIIILPTAKPDEAPILVSPGAEEVEVVQPSVAVAVDRIALDRITYRDGGDVIATGRGRERSAVRTYVNGRLVHEAEVGDAGNWKATIPRGLAKAAALIRFDEISASGDVTSRLETPFEYAGEGTVHEVRQRKIVIQRGNNLWRIAEQHYGDGLRYSVIFSANADLIRDPDLIYPDQVFTIPELVESE